MNNINDMMIFAAVAECESFTGAALSMRMPKSTVSQRITRLETRLGLRLLNRSTRRVSLTGNGQVFLNHCRQIRSDITSAEMAMSKLREQPVGRLRLTCPEITAIYFMPDLVRDFRDAFPEIEIELIATNDNIDLIQDQIDFAFRAGELTDSELIARYVAPLKRILVASPGYLNKHGRPLSPENLASHNCLVHLSMKDWSMKSSDRSFQFSPHLQLFSDSQSFLLQSCLRDQGISILPAYVCSEHLKRGELEWLLPDWRIPDNHFSLIYPSRKNFSRSQAVFLQFVQSYSVSVLSGLSL